MEAPYKIEHNEYKESEMSKCTELANWAKELGVNAFQNQWSQQQSEGKQRETGLTLGNNYASTFEVALEDNCLLF